MISVSANPQRVWQLVCSAVVDLAAWRAPESFTSSIRMPTVAQDVYAFGCLLFVVMTGKLPFWWLGSSEALVEFRCNFPARQCLNEALDLTRFQYRIEKDDKNVLRRKLMSMADQCMQAEPGERPAMGTIMESLAKLMGDSTHVILGDVKTTYN
jgi:serine/threonine protein kinase